MAFGDIIDAQTCRYMENPLLVGTEGFKFDIRCYLLVARTCPTVLAFYHPGYCRLTLKPYTASEDAIDDPSIHLTNAAIQKKDPLYKDNKESQIRTGKLCYTCRLIHL
jgi:tubulin polyglutamylase TTLL2